MKRMSVRYAHFHFCISVLPRQAWQVFKTKMPAFAGHSFHSAEREGFEPSLIFIINQLVTTRNLITPHFTLQLILKELVVFVKIEIFIEIEFFLQLLASLNRCFFESFIALNIINFVTMVTREKDEVS